MRQSLAEPSPSPNPQEAPPASRESAGATTCSIPGTRTRCLHCGLRLSEDQVAAARDFCCSGCERVHALLRDASLTRFYDLRGGEGIPPAAPRSGGYAWLDPWLEPMLAAPGRPHRLSLDVQGIHCAACVWLLETLFRRFPGGVELRINPSLGVADLIFVPARGDIRAWLREVESFGYRFGLPRKPAPARSRELLIRLGVTTAAAVHVMMFSLAYYFGLAATDGLVYTALGRLSLAFTFVAVAAGGWIFFRAAWLGLERRVAHLDLPIAAGILLAFGGSVLAYFRHGPEAAYFDTVSIFITLMVLGRWLQERLLERNRNALLADGGVDALYTRRLDEGRVTSIPAAEVRRGDALAVVPGDLVPVEAIVLDRPARVSLDWITGESDPVEAAAGERVPAGAFNAGVETMRVAAQEDFAESRLVDLLRSPAPREGRDDESAGRRWWNRVSTIYVIAVFALAAIGFLLWAPRGLEKALMVTVAVLVVTCPCALGLAVPLAQELTLLALKRRGIFVRAAGFLDRALTVRKIVFDKTGTLTLGRLVLAAESQAALAALAPADRIALAHLTAFSNHPVSRALHGAAGNGADAAAPTEAPREIAGHGVELATPHGAYRLGRRAFALGAAAGGDADTVFARDGAELAAFRFVEELKGDAPREIERLGGEGYEVYVLSGDRGEAVARAAATLGIPAERAHAGSTPEAKAAWLRSVDDRDTLMVGDGINDGPSFEAAWCAATPAVDHPSLPARADFYFLGEGIAAVRRALTAARRLRTVTRDALLFAALYNAVILTLCYMGRVSPVTAAVLMPLSSAALVTATARRLGGKEARWMS